MTARKIAPNAVRGAHVLDGSLVATDFKSGQLPAGPEGDKGAQGATGLSGLVRVTASSPNTSSNKSASSRALPERRWWAGDSSSQRIRG